MKPLLTKVIATLGPATAAPDMIRGLIENGVRVFRVNFSHGTFDEHSQLIENVRSASAELSVLVGILGDLSGPKIRIGEVVEGGVMLEPGQSVEFVKQSVVTAEAQSAGQRVAFSTSYAKLVEEVQPGQDLLLDDGKVRLHCLEKAGSGEQQRLVCEVTHGGPITSRKGLNLPQTELSLPALTEKDYACARYAVEHDLDYLALSFVRAPEDVHALRALLAELEHEKKSAAQGQAGEPTDPWDELLLTPIISKIEKPQAVERIEEIVEASDGIMVARGDLGVEMDLAEVPVVQKRVIEHCHALGKPVIVATQMLESMIQSPTPTRAETSDVANAIFDGADAVMLSGETSVGKWPLRAAEVMGRVAQQANAYLVQKPFDFGMPRKLADRGRQSAAMAEGVRVMAPNIDAKAVITWATTDGMVVSLSRTKASRPILLFGDQESTLRKAVLLYGVEPVQIPRPANPVAFVAAADEVILQRKWAEKGDVVLFLLPLSLRDGAATDGLYVHRLGHPVK
jgi:pyruvate kinase